MNWDYLKVAVKNLSQRKLRTWLTIISVIIGIAAIIGLVTITQGLENYVTYTFEQMGTNKIYVFPKNMLDPAGLEGLSQDDVDALEGLSEIEYLIPMFTGSVKAEFKQDVKMLLFIAFPPELTEDWFEDFGIGLSEGRFFEREGYHMFAGYKIGKDIFDTEVRINNKVELDGKKFKVIGIVEEVGNPQDDSQLYLTLETARELFGKPDSVSMIYIILKENVDPSEAAAKIARTLEKERDDENFEVQTAEQLLEQFGSILGIIQVVLVGVAAISLLVGAVGISNSMYTSVLQRTREIGIMKSIGAKNSDITLLFLIESGILGLVGGIIGTIIGIFGAELVGFAAAQAGYAVFRIEYSIGLIIFSIAFAIMIGMISGVFPAKNAAKMKPVDALRK
ncbi:ABC transporter permease [Candidatus Woesearchaeota archaeon]|nr:ABC transporter permease [Candidatus Woesearchaeota archaeon]